MLETSALKTRSRRTNGRLIAGLDGRGKVGRRIRDIANALAAPLGGMATLDDAQQAAVMRAAELSCAAELERGKLVRGDSSANVAETVKLENLAARAMREITGQRTSPAKPTFTPLRERLLQEAQDA